MSAYQVLTDAHVQHFLDKGYLVVNDCLDPGVAKRWVGEAYQRLGYDPVDTGTWEKDIIWMNHKNQMPVKQLAPKAWAAICDVVGGEERLETRVMEIESKHFSSINSFEWSDAFIANFRRGADKPWQPPSADVGGWHVDGSYFRHFLDSREQALLTIVLWSDMLHKGGGTFIAPDSVRVVARFLAEHPEGVPPGGFDFPALAKQCTQFEEITGKAGDFVILHPFMLHASSQNVIKQPRFMTNPPIVLKEPMQLNRGNQADYSLLERATLHYLDKPHFAFEPSAPRDSYWWPAGERV
jgi:Phytanoyl-CoA dioxygenase (PhyH)